MATRSDDIAVVMGGAICVWYDVLRFQALWPGDVITMATNETGWQYPGRLDHWVTLHPENFERKSWIAKRAIKDYTTWSHRWNVDEYWEHWGAGSSGLYCVTIALEKLKIEKIVLCGVPMDTQGNVDGRDEWAMKEVAIHREGWKKHLPKIKDHVRSMSGWTRELLGEPTREWLCA